MKYIIVWALSFVTAFIFTLIGMAMWRSATGQNDHIYLFHGSSAAYVADSACTIDTPLNRDVKSMKRSFDECVRLHKIHQKKDQNESPGGN
jgi:hypothetical protein